MEDDSPRPSADVDAELLHAAQSAPEGDLRAFEELVRRYQNRIRANCRYLTRDDNNVEDLTQEVFVKAYFGLSKFEGRSTFRHWIKRIKVNHCLNHMGRKKETVGLEDTPGCLRTSRAPERGGTDRADGGAGTNQCRSGSVA